MRIGFITSGGSVPWGGSEILWSECAHRLLAGGHEVFVSVPRWPGTPPAIERLEKAGAIVDQRRPGPPALPRRVLGKVFRGFASECDPGTRRKLLGFRPALVCVSHGDTGLAHPWMLLLRERGIPYVSVSQMNAEFLWPIESRAQSLIAAHSGALASLFVSEGNLRLFEAQLGVRLTNAGVVRNPFQVPYDIELAWPAESSPLRLACVGRLDPWAKGQDLILELFAKEPWRSRDICVAFYGTGEGEASLRRYARLLGVGANVEFAGYVPDVTEIWKRHHGLLLPSRYEGLALALVESMLCGRVPIVTAVGGHAEVVSDGDTGFLAPAATASLLEATLERAWVRRAEWKEIGRRAQSHVRAQVPPDPAGHLAGELLRYAAQKRTPA